MRNPKNWRPTVWSLRNYGMIFLCLAMLSGCAANEDWVRFRPDPTSPFSGVEQPHPKAYTGQVSFLRGLYELNLDSEPKQVFEDAFQLDDIDGYGLWISARPAEWYIAPEFGFIMSEEDNGLLGDIKFTEIFAGGRVVAELPFTPTSVFAGLGITSLKADVDALNFDKELSASYFHFGVLLHMGDNAHLGLDYRIVDYGKDLSELHPSGDPNSMDTLSIMAGVNW